MADDVQWHSRATWGLVVCAATAVVLIVVLLVVIGWLPYINAALLLPFVFGLYCLTVIADSRRGQLAAVLVLTFIAGFFVAIFEPAGFNYPLVWSPGPLYDGGQPLLLYVNLSKAIGGFLVVILLDVRMRKQSPAPSDNRPVISQVALVLAGASSILFVAYAFFDVDWEPKLPQGIFYFVGVNSLVDVLSEEAFFRLLLQTQIERFFRNKRIGICVGVAVASVLFALGHAGATGVMFLLSLFAGFVYAAVYSETGSLLASSATHFGVNITHILLLEYPL